MNFRTTTLLAVLAIFSMPVWGKDCSSSDIILNTQQDVDSFQATYGNGGTCDRVTGSLGINGSDITDISGLNKLTSIGADLFIVSNLTLTNIDGLSKITNVGADLFIQDNTSLQNMDGLIGLTNLGGGLNVSNNNKLNHLNGLANLLGAGSGLFISGNPALGSITGLAKLTSAPYLYIYGNISLPNINGLGNITTVDAGLTISANINLRNIDALTKLTSVGGGLRITENQVLADIDALVRLTSIGGDLTIAENDTLTNINGLSKLTNVGGDIEISDNADLISLTGLSRLTRANDSLIIVNNASLKNLNGLDAISRTLGGLYITDNAVLADIGGLTGLTSVGEDLYIQNNAALTNFDGLNQLASISGDLFIFENSALTNINGLVKLTSVAGSMEIESNPALSNCTALAYVLGWPQGAGHDRVGYVSISGNAAGCDSVAEILGAVSGPTAPVINSYESLDGKVYINFFASTTTDVLWSINGYQALCRSEEKSIFENTTVTSIPDQSSVVSKLTVSGAPYRTGAELNIPVNITHPSTSQLTVTLTSPNGISVKLWDKAVVDGGNLVGTFPTTLQPAESLDAFDGLDFNGQWQLTVSDTVASQTGTLDSWGITVRDISTITATSTESPIALTGLLSDRIYTCTVAAVTGLGTGPASNAVSVTAGGGGTVFAINAGLNDAWFYPVTDGQGFFITVFPNVGYVSLSWFTYDTDRPDDSVTANLGEPGHRWINAVGEYSGNRVVMDISVASGGLFDTSTDITRVNDGTIILTFNDCNSGTVEYDIPSINRQGTVPIQRITNDNIALCETLAEQAPAQVNSDKQKDNISSVSTPTVNALPLTAMNAGLNDAWYYPQTDGQGFFITVFGDLELVTLSWFTYDTARPDPGVTANLGEPGHRWFNAAGNFSGTEAVMDISFTSGGIFDTATEIVRDSEGTGTIILTFSDCENGTVEYDIPSIDQKGTVPIQRVSNDNVAMCEQLNAN